MNRGALLIKRPDGRLSEYPIEKPEVSVGRAPDSDIVIDDTSVSRYQLRVKIEGDRASIIDAKSTNGTFIGSNRVSSVTPSPLFEDQMAHAGGLEIRFIPPRREVEDIQPPETEPGEMRSRLASLAPPVSLDGEPIQLALSGPDQPIGPGELTTADLVIHNRGMVSDELQIQVSGLPAEWVRFGQDRVQLLPQDQIKIILMFQPPPGSDSIGADYPFTVNVASREHRTKVNVAGLLRVLTRHALAVQIQPARSSKTFHVQLENRGNGEARCQLSGADDDQLLKFHFEYEAVQLPAGQHQSIELQVKPKTRLTNQDRQPRLVNFEVLAASEHSTVQTTGLLEIPNARRWKVLVLGVLLFALALGGGWAYTRYCPQLAFCPSAAKPSINSFTATPIELLRGGTVIIGWDVGNADQVQLIKPDTQTLSNNGMATFNLARTTDFTLRATNAGGIIERTITVNVK